MKRYLIPLFLFFGCDSQKINWFDGTLDQAFQLKDNKIVMIDFYTDTWGACHRLDADTFSDLEVQKFSENNFISIKMNANDKDARKLFDEYN